MMSRTVTKSGYEDEGDEASALDEPSEEDSESEDEEDSEEEIKPRKRKPKKAVKSTAKFSETLSTP